MKGPQSFLFKEVVRLLFFLVNALAFYLLLRGHNQPGGGFSAGLATAISLILLSLASGLEEVRRVFRVDPVRVAAVGLTVATLTGLGPLLVERPFLEHFHAHLADLPLLGDLEVGTPFLFDGGVYLIVVGIVCKIIFVLGQSTQHLRALAAMEEARYSSPVEKPVEDVPPLVPGQGSPPNEPHAS